MALDKHFCSSPWFHVRIDNQGNYQPCRWALTQPAPQVESIITFFKQDMSTLRFDLINGENVSMCSPCHDMEKHGKISGRQRQLLKTGIQLSNFEKTLLSSPWIDEFRYAYQTSGNTHQLPIDWQIDLGNYCNSGCVYCSPSYSSSLAEEFIKLKLIDTAPINSWCNDRTRLNSFVKDLCNIDGLHYLHFIGGETLITPAFKVILKSLIETNKADIITIGFTTNLTVWDDEIANLLTPFKSVNIGLSVDAFTELNSYARWPSNLLTVKLHADKWVNLARSNNWAVQLRPTPTWLTVRDLVSLYDYAWEHNIIVESCNFLHEPAYLRMAVLPQSIRNAIADNINDWLTSHPLTDAATVINTRHPDTTHDMIHQDLVSYVNHLRNTPDETHLMSDAVVYLKKLESIRQNSVLTYLPEYEDILRAAGY